LTAICSEISDYWLTWLARMKQKWETWRDSSTFATAT